MANHKHWAYTDLSRPDALVLIIEGVGEFHVAQFTATYAVNEIPQATCMLAIGRDARSEQASVFAKINEPGVADELFQFRKVKVRFNPAKEWDPHGGKEWGNEPKTIFEGYLAGVALRKIAGKVQIIAHLTHWLTDLTFSSVLTELSHPGNHRNLTTPAVFGDATGAAKTEPLYIVNHLAREAIRDKLGTDLWEGIKMFLCGLAENSSIVEFNVSGTCAGAGQDIPGGDNKQALTALRKIEGPGSSCTLAYTKPFVKPLKMQSKALNTPEIKDAIADAINHITFFDVANQTFWDVLLGLCARFSMAVAPLVDRTVIFADCPGFRGKEYEKKLSPNEFNALDMQSALSKPLRAVAVIGDTESSAMFEITEQAQAAGKTSLLIGGCYAEDATEGGPLGPVIFVESPIWLKNYTYEIRAKDGTGVGGQHPGPNNYDPSVSPPFSGRPRSKLLSDTLIQDLYNEYAHSVYVLNTLRGRVATISGKLRFDISPGALLRVQRQHEKALSTKFDFGTDLFGHVNRVTFNINSESQLAGTTFQLTSVRTERENTEDRTSVDKHPLFGDDIFLGCPMHLPELEWLFKTTP